MTSAPARTHRVWRTLALALAVLLPAGAAGFLVGALAGAPDRVDAIPAAVVNEDEMIVSTADDGTETMMFAGRQLVTDLTAPEHDGFDWTITNAEEAQELLDSGQVAAVLTIPADFSERILSLQGDEPEQAGITIVASDAHDYVSGALADQVAQSLAATFGSVVTEQFVAGVYGGMSTMSEQLGAAADGATELAAGTDALADGLADADTGSGTLATGLGQTEAGASALATGASDLATGLGTAQSGASELATGGAGLASGIQSYTAGVDQLAAGLNELNSGIAPLAGLSSALGSAQANAQEAAAALNNLLLLAQSDPNADPSLVQGLSDLAAALQSGADGGALGGAQGQIDALLAGVGELSAGANALAANSESLRSGSSSLAAGLTALNDGLAQSASGASTLASGAGELSSGITALSDGADALHAGIAEASSGASQLAGGAAELSDGLSAGVDALPSMSESHVDALAGVVAEPVTYDAETLGGVSSAARVATLAMPSAVWLGAVLLLLLLAPRIVRQVQTTASLPRVAWRISWRPLALIGAGSVIAAALLPLMGASWAAFPVALVALLLLAIIATLGTAALVTLWGRAGYLVASGLLLLQAVAAGAVIPTQLLAAPVQAVAPVLPLTYGVGALHQSFAGASAAGDIVALVIFAVLTALLLLAALAHARTRATRDFIERSPRGAPAPALG